MTDEKKPGHEVMEDMSLENTDEEKKEQDADAKKVITDMTLDEKSADSTIDAKNFNTRVEKLFPDKVYIYMTPDDPLCKLEDGGYSLKGAALADLTDEWKKKLDRFLKEREG